MSVFYKKIHGTKKIYLSDCLLDSSLQSFSNLQNYTIQAIFFIIFILFIGLYFHSHHQFVFPILARFFKFITKILYGQVYLSGSNQLWKVKSKSSEILLYNELDSRVNQFFYDSYEKLKNTANGKHLTGSESNGLTFLSSWVNLSLQVNLLFI